MGEIYYNEIRIIVLQVSVLVLILQVILNGKIT